MESLPAAFLPSDAANRDTEDDKDKECEHCKDGCHGDNRNWQIRKLRDLWSQAAAAYLLHLIVEMRKNQYKLLFNR